MNYLLTLVQKLKKRTQSADDAISFLIWSKEFRQKHHLCLLSSHVRVLSLSLQVGVPICSKRSVFF